MTKNASQTWSTLRLISEQSTPGGPGFAQAAFAARKPKWSKTRDSMSMSTDIRSNSRIPSIKRVMLELVLLSQTNSASIVIAHTEPSVGQLKQVEGLSKLQPQATYE